MFESNVINPVELRQKRAALIAQAGEILKRVKADGDRALTTEEQKTFDGLHDQAERMLADVDRIELQHETEIGLAAIPRPASERLAARHQAERPGTPRTIGYTREGREVRAYAPDAPVAEAGDAEMARATLGGIVRGLSTGNWAGLDADRRALTSGSGSLGGFLLPSPVSGRFVDLARAKTVTIQAGAQTIPFEDATLTIARLVTDPTASWRPENVAITASDLTFDGFTFTPRTLAALVTAPLELVEDAPNLGQIVEDALSAALALELDRVMLRGTGAAAEPRGIANTTGVQAALAIAVPSYDDFSNAAQLVALQNGGATAAILSPRDAGILDRLKDSTGQPLNPPESWKALRKFQTTQIPTNLGGGTNESEAYVGDFAQLWLGMRRAITVEASKHASDSTNSAFKQIQVWIRAYLRADVAIARPAHLVYMSGITAS